jgi:hypothetical protein
MLLAPTRDLGGTLPEVALLTVPAETAPVVAVPGTTDHTPAYRGDIVDAWGRDPFPASDPPANW